MTKPEFHGTGPLDPDGDLAVLRGDCARMVPHWAPPEKSTSRPGHWAPPEKSTSRPVSPSRIHGVSVPPASARLLEAMSDYGD
ncbi:hypothetical protein ACFY2Z_01015 [Streptomyces sp. NPDC001222]|uniref:hypothetical protein n=1 Tax=Streptomyces sp. NPDC001222 TaxID=3364548 RepID=UPI00369F2A20